MRPGADAGDDVHAVFGAELDEAAEIFVAGPVPLAFDFFVMDPDDVGGDDLDAGGFHLEDFGFPLGFGNAGVVDFAHDGEPGFAVEGEVLGVEAEGVAGGGSGVGGVVGVVRGAGRGGGAEASMTRGCGGVAWARSGWAVRQRVATEIASAIGRMWFVMAAMLSGKGGAARTQDGVVGPLLDKASGRI